MLKPRKMKIADCTCMLCGCALGLEITGVRTGDNPGACRMCGEPFILNITREEMEEFLEAEEDRPLRQDH